MDDARRHFALAWRESQGGGGARVTAMMGAAGTGKSHLARGLAVELGATLVTSDAVRKELVGMAPTTRVDADVGGGIYDRDHTGRIYVEAGKRARQWLERGVPVVLDATYLTAYARDGAWRVAERFDVPFHVICEASEAVVADRLARRPDDPDEVSDAGWEVHAFQCERIEPPSELPDGAVIRMQTDGALAPLAQHVAGRLRGA